MAARKTASEPSLTPRECEVLAGVGHRLTNAEIADQLFLSKRTVESYVSSLYAKLQLSSRHDLCVAAAHWASQPTGAPDSDRPPAEPSGSGPTAHWRLTAVHRLEQQIRVQDRQIARGRKQVERSNRRIASVHQLPPDADRSASS